MNLKNVPEAGIEPALPYGKQILSLSCLPIPPLGQILRRSYVVLSLLFCSCTLRNSPQEQSVEFRTIQALQMAWHRNQMDDVHQILSQDFEHPEIYWAIGARLFAQRGRTEWSLTDLKQGRAYALQCVWEDVHFRTLVQANNGLISAQSVQALDMGNANLVECSRWLTISWALMLQYRGSQGAVSDIQTLQRLGVWLRTIPTIQDDPWTIYAELQVTLLGTDVNWSRVKTLFEELEAVGKFDTLLDFEKVILMDRHLSHNAFCSVDGAEWAMLSKSHLQRLSDAQYLCTSLD